MCVCVCMCGYIASKTKDNRGKAIDIQELTGWCNSFGLDRNMQWLANMNILGIISAQLHETS